MIDYDKLHEAHELADRYTKETGDAVTIASYCYIGQDIVHSLCFPCYSDNDDLHRVTIDELIDKLRELTNKAKKYKHGDIVWVVLQDAPKTAEVVHCDIPGFYSIAGRMYLIEESKLYATRNELIQAQIEHWQSLQETDK